MFIYQNFTSIIHIASTKCQYIIIKLHIAEVNIKLFSTLQKIFYKEIYLKETCWACNDSMTMGMVAQFSVDGLICISKNSLACKFKNINPIIPATPIKITPGFPSKILFE
jgi:hypothetical protein